MSKGKYKPQPPDVMEAVFDAGYLIFDLVAGILFFVLRLIFCAAYPKPVKKCTALFIAPQVRQVSHETAQRA